MSQDFVTRLERQLSDAERRQERAGRISRILACTRASLPSPVLAGTLAAGAAVLIALALGVIMLTRDSDELTVVRPAPPSVVARLPLGESPLSDLASGFGAAWIGGLDREDVMRVDVATRQIVARIPVGRLSSGIVTTADAVWVVVNPDTKPTTLLRIDPRTNRVTTRVPLPAGTVDRGITGAGPRLIGDSRKLWLLGARGAARIDSRTGAVAGRVRWNIRGDDFAQDFALDGNDLWVHSVGGRLLRYDARDGTERASFSSVHGQVGLAAMSGTGVVVAGADGSVSRIEARTGRARWAGRLAGAGPRPASSSSRWIAIVAGEVWVLSANPARGTARLVALDLATGQALRTTALHDGGPDLLVPIGDELWFTNASGQAIVVKP